MSNITMQDIAVMSVQYVQHTFEFYLDSMRRCGLKNIDLWGGAPHFCRYDYASNQAVARRIAEMRRQMEDMGLKVVIYTPETLGYPFSYSNPQQALRDRTLDFMEASMEDALNFGTDKVFLNTGCHPRDLDREEGWKRTVDSIGRLALRAERMGVKLVLEQLQPYESNLLLSLADMKRMLREVNSPALVTCVDLVAMEVAGDTLEDFCKELDPLLRQPPRDSGHGRVRPRKAGRLHPYPGKIRLQELRGFGDQRFHLLGGPAHVHSAVGGLSAHLPAGKIRKL